MPEIRDLNVNDSTNTGRFPPGMNINAIDNGARALEGMIARFHRDIAGYNLTTGTGSAYQVTASAAYTAYATGLLLLIRFHVVCLDSATLNVNGLGAKPLRRHGNTTLRAGDIAANEQCLLAYNSATDALELIGVGENHLGTYTVATLPTTGVVAGNTAYASNGRKNAEGAGAGTGVMVFRDASAWRACDTGATVAA